jgi:outer membrane lipoprotein-sorting protein
MTTASSFYVTGGTLRPDAPSYVERQADKDLYDGLRRGEFCYVLTSRQMGKSSLMVRTVIRLRQQGFSVAVLDLTAIGQNVSIEQWYDGLMARLGQQLDLEDELLEFWHRHTHWGPLQRWTTALEKIILPSRPGNLAIFVDEIDIVRSLSFSTDEFFAAIRECHNRRSHDPQFNRLSFCLLGVATPTDLIRETKMTPFNIGRRIELNDFSENEAAPLAQGLSDNTSYGQLLLSRVLYWTGGHPYLTQRLCRGIYDYVRAGGPDGRSTSPALPPVIPTPAMVDRLAANLFLSREARERDDNLVFVRDRILRSECDLASLLALYREVRSDKPVPDDEANPLVSVLRLSGIGRGVRGQLEVRNRIYLQVFDLGWIRTNMPAAEVRRQRKAMRKGVVIGVALVLVILLSSVYLKPEITRRVHSLLKAKVLASMLTAYQGLQSYADTYEVLVEMQIGGLKIPVKGAGTLLLQKPNKTSQSLTGSARSFGLEMQTVTDGQRMWIYLPGLKEYAIRNTLPSPEPANAARELVTRLGPVGVSALYHLFLTEGASLRFAGDAHDIQYVGKQTIDGHETSVVHWEHSPEFLLRSLGWTNAPGWTQTNLAVTAWVDPQGWVRQIRVDLSPWANALLSVESDVSVSQMVVTETHRNIRPNPKLAEDTFAFQAPPDARQVEQFDAPPSAALDPAFYRQGLAKRIPPRYPLTLPGMVDLTEFYNAPLTEPWHPGDPGNNLAALPGGILVFSGVPFDVRGLIQLSSRSMLAAGGDFPQRVTGIKLGQKCRRLHFLQAAAWRDQPGKRIGSYVLHYAGGQEQILPVIYGDDLRDWHMQSDSTRELRRATTVWMGRNAADFIVRLFVSTRENPLPELSIESIDFVSDMADAAPFLIALTAEP